MMKIVHVVVLSALLAVALAKPKPGRFWGEEGCGTSRYPDAGTPQQFVIGGQEARENEFPFQVMLQLRGSFICGGSVIASNTVLTAAHCTDRTQPSALSVVVGNHAISVTDEFELVIDVVSNIVHEDYDATGNIENDIALLTLSTTLTYNDGVQPVCPPAKHQDDIIGVMAFVAGWGNIEGEGSNYPDILHFAHDIPMMDHTVCATCFPEGWVDDTMVCAGYCGSNAKDTCQGDSGGPLFIKNDDGVFEQVGITSWGLGCADSTPGVYADLFYLSPWIDANIESV